jgi:hypothetical protein
MKRWIAPSIAFVVGAGLGGFSQPKPIAPVPPEDVRVWQSVRDGLSLEDVERVIGVKGGSDVASTQGAVKVLNRSYRIGDGAITIRYEQAPGDEGFKVANKLMLDKFE